MIKKNTRSIVIALYCLLFTACSTTSPSLQDTHESAYPGSHPGTYPAANSDLHPDTHHPGRHSQHPSTHEHMLYNSNQDMHQGSQKGVPRVTQPRQAKIIKARPNTAMKRGRASALMMKKNQRNLIPVLMYHSIAPQPTNKFRISPLEFEEHIRTILKKGYTPITTTELQNALKRGTPLPKRPILLTLDDGYKDNFTYAYPILKKYRVKATIFVITNTISRYPAYLTWSQMNTMQRSGLIDFESHTISHPNLKKLPPSTLKNEIMLSKKILESHLHKRVEAFCYPYGEYSAEAVKLVQQAGYGLAFTTKFGNSNYVQQGPYELHRIGIYPGTNISYFLLIHL